MSAVRMPTGGGCNVEIDTAPGRLVCIREIGPRGSVRAGIFLTPAEARDLARLLRQAASISDAETLRRDRIAKHGMDCACDACLRFWRDDQGRQVLERSNTRVAPESPR